MANDDVLDLWSAAGLETVTLPSGFAVRVKLSEPKDLIVRGLLPPQLIHDVIARESAGGMASVSEEDPDLAARLVSSMQSLIADAIRQVRAPDGEWLPVTVSIERLATFPSEDREKLEELVTGALTGRAASAEAELAAGTIDQETHDRIAREEAAGTVAAYAEFRDEPPRDADRPSGEDVRDPTGPADRTAAASGGARGRRRAGRATLDR